MPLYEEKIICPFSVRFSQARIRPTFQDGRRVEKSLAQIEAVPWPLKEGSYDLFLDVPFPPIEIIRWHPRLRAEDGRKIENRDGTLLLGEACWFTFDNRRLYCLQAAAAKQWPRRAAAVVHVMRDLPASRSTPRKFRTTDLGCSVRIARRHDVVPRATWCWSEATRNGVDTPSFSSATLAALEAVREDAAKEDTELLLDVPSNFFSSPAAMSFAEAAAAAASAAGTNTGLLSEAANSQELHARTEPCSSGSLPAASSEPGCAVAAINESSESLHEDIAEDGTQETEAT